jgi:hypothetical protein
LSLSKKAPPGPGPQEWLCLSTESCQLLNFSGLKFRTT